MINRRTMQGAFNLVKLSKDWAKLIGILFLSIWGSDRAEASCLLSYDTAQVVSQGDGITRLSFQGGKEGLGSHLEGRLGLPGERSVHLRVGGCERASLWGWAVEAGLNQHLLTAEETGFLDLGFRVSMVMMTADDEASAYSEIGLQPVLMASYPFLISKGEIKREDRIGAVTLSLGMTTYFVDRRDYKQSYDGTNVIEEAELSSSVEWQPLVSLSGSVDILTMLPLALEVRWQQGGVYGGASVGYQF